MRGWLQGFYLINYFRGSCEVSRGSQGVFCQVMGEFAGNQGLLLPVVAVHVRPILLTSLQQVSSERFF